jgi:hypothetical protein
LHSYSNSTWRIYKGIFFSISTPVTWPSTHSRFNISMDLMYIKFNVHKMPSKSSPYEFNLHFKPSVFVRKPFL